GHRRRGGRRLATAGAGGSGGTERARRGESSAWLIAAGHFNPVRGHESEPYAQPDTRGRFEQARGPSLGGGKEGKRNHRALAVARVAFPRRAAQISSHRRSRGQGLPAKRFRRRLSLAPPPLRVAHLPCIPVTHVTLQPL